MGEAPAAANEGSNRAPGSA